ncbi:hypothetical protein EAG_09986 [Camponotus floridanus]|uniref:Uncharacterized protein n=1 Tax=Camponotus floridanus TaxID=104421 RepID=E1ZY34_CAMFO|nr:hypothetical protein EAG_09986 [Camponotus floridanus]
MQGSSVPRTIERGRKVDAGRKKVRGRQRRDGGIGELPANGSIKFMGALRWFQTPWLAGSKYKGCLAWESRAPTIISPFHRDRHVLPSSSTSCLRGSPRSFIARRSLQLQWKPA